MSVFIQLFGASPSGTKTTPEAPTKSEVSRLRAQVEELQRRLDTMTLAAQAMWELLRAHGRFSDTDLLEKMQEVDLRDGEADGRISSGLVNCPGCGRRNRTSRRHCVFCGAALPTPHVVG